MIGQPTGQSLQVKHHFLSVHWLFSVAKYFCSSVFPVNADDFVIKMPFKSTQQGRNFWSKMSKCHKYILTQTFWTGEILRRRKKLSIFHSKCSSCCPIYFSSLNAKQMCTDVGILPHQAQPCISLGNTSHKHSFTPVQVRHNTVFISNKAYLPGLKSDNEKKMIDLILKQ